MTVAEQVASAFHAALASGSWTATCGLCTDDARWILPGDNAISGEADEVNAVVARARLIASYGMRFDLKYVLVSRSNMALSQHNTAEHSGRCLDQYVATVWRLRGDQICEIETFVSDLDGFNRFFAGQPNLGDAG